MINRFLTTGLLFCSVALAPVTAAAAEKTYTIKMATVAPEGSPWHDSLTRIQKKWEGESKGRLKLRAFMGGKLGDENQTVSETKRGNLQMVGASAGAVGSMVPEVNFLELPFLFRDTAEADYILDQVIGKDLEKIFADRGFVFLMWSENGYRHFGSNWAPIRKPEDMKGHKMRSQENRIHLSTYRALGALPVPIATTEVLPALQTGVVEGYDQTPLFAFAIGLHTQSKYWTVSDHMYQPGVILMHKGFYDSLPKDLQTLIMSERQKETEEARVGIRALTPLLVQNLGAAGLTVIELTETERAAFEKAVQPVYKEFEKEAPPRSLELYKKTVKALAEYRAKNKK
jgi:tripartite ATP-independent transporter DctP family solute receptor